MKPKRNKNLKGKKTRKQNIVPVSEYFYSLQGEGRHIGTPAVFLRTSGCNFLCGGKKAKQEYKNTKYEKKTKEMAENLEANKGSWICDTISEWMEKEKFTNRELYSEWRKKEFIEKIDEGSHIVITGGEPLIHQDKIVRFLDYLEKKGHNPFIEIESNGSIWPKKQLQKHINQYNLSPKLSNSGLKKETRYKPEIIKKYISKYTDNNSNSITADLKFVVSCQKDWKEIQEKYISRFDIPKTNIYLMPAGKNQKELQLKRKDIIKLAKQTGTKYTERLHIMIWNKTTGV